MDRAVPSPRKFNKKKAESETDKSKVEKEQNQTKADKKSEKKTKRGNKVKVPKDTASRTQRPLGEPGGILVR